MKKWYAVKRTKSSRSYAFYPPSPKNIETIKAIAPDCGNFEVNILVDFKELCAERAKSAKLAKALEDVRPNLERIEQEILLCKKQYRMTMYPTIGIRHLSMIDKVLKEYKRGLK